MANKHLESLKFPGLSDIYTMTPEIASEYSSSATYAVGDYAVHSGKLYQCTTAISTAEAWTAAHWTEAKLADDVSQLKEDFTNDIEILANGKENVSFSVILNKGFNRNDGTFPDENNWDITDFIPVSGEDTIYIDNLLYKSDYNGWYTSDRTYIGWFSVPVGTDIEFTPPKNAGFMVLSNGHNRWSYTVKKNVQILATKSEVEEVEQEFDEFKDSVAKTIISKNRYNGEYTLDKFVSNVDGKLYDSSSYCATDYIDISQYNSIVISRHNQNVGLRYALYSNNNENSFISGGIPDSIVNTELNRFYCVINTESANYIRFSGTPSLFNNPTVSQLMLENGTVPTIYKEYFEDYYTIDVENNNQLESTVLGKSLSIVSGSMQNGTKFEVETNSIRKSNQIVFFGKFSAFDTLYVGHGETGSNTEFIAIDNTNIYYAFNGNLPSEGYPHGLTISTYLGVIIKISDDCIASITIYTLGGSYSRTLPSTSPWLGCSGEIFAKSVNSTFTMAKLTWNADYQKNKWFFGDSYMTNYSASRWPYYMQQSGFDNALINAFPGEASTSAYQNWQTALGHGKPKYALWALGMNDTDSGAINTNWLNAITAFIEDCETYGITPILATIPNTPTQTHTYKNAYVKSLDYRYIDFAEAVGASSAGSTWYPGCLSNDNIHPTETGAILLYLQALIDFPEIMQK